MGWLRKKAKQLGKVFKKVGKKLKKGLGKIAKAFGKLGPLGSIALSFILPGLGNIAGWLGNTISAMGPAGKFLVDVSTSIYKAASGAFDYVKGKITTGLGKVFNTVSGAIENGMNTVSSAFGGKGEIGSNFRNFVSDLTNGFVEKSEKGLALEKNQAVVTDVVEDVVTDTVEDTVVDNVKDKKLSITETIKNKDLKLKEKINTSKEFAAYKKIQPISMAGQQMIQGEEAYEAQVAYLANRKSDYFKEQSDYQLAPLEQQNYAQVVDMPMFVDFSNFNPAQDPAQQYLAYRGITDYINPMDIGGYGFDYQQFLQAQLGDRNYA
tara:strand:+ start:2814 stop:3779 length:966 start_codon:yes stop_codon:yes gene_type:complete